MAATVQRDERGAPHIHGEETEIAEALGRCMAQDRAAAVVRSYLEARGEAARWFGEELLEQDFERRHWRIAEVAQAGLAHHPPEVIAWLDAFCEGFNAHVDQHAGELPEHVRPITPGDVAALEFWTSMMWVLRTAQDKLPGEDAPMPEASNHWAVAAERTAEGAVIGLIDPHVPLDGMYRWYECHLHAPDFEVHGFCLNGAPFPTLGVTDHHFWAATMGGVDCAGCYEERLDADHPDCYRDGGAWRPMRVREVTVEVKRGEAIQTETRALKWTARGVVARELPDRAYVLRTSYDDRPGLIVQTYRMMKARSLEQYLDALRMLQWPNMNLLYGDVEGNIHWVCNGYAPVRSNDYDWSKPTPGDDPGAAWEGHHDFGDLPQVLNPPAGWVQNCNVAPVHVTPSSGLQMANFPGLRAVIPEEQWNARGSLACAYLQEADRLTPEGAIGIAFSTTTINHAHWVGRLAEAWEAGPSEDDITADAADLLLAWDGEASRESTGATLYHFWRRYLTETSPELGGDISRHSSPWSAELQTNAVEALKNAAAQLVELKGRVDVPWGEMVVLARGEKTWPLAGGSGPPETMRATCWGEYDPAVGGMVCSGGATCTTIVQLTKPPRAWCLLPYGQSDDPKSPHFDDQAEGYSAGEFRRLV